MSDSTTKSGLRHTAQAAMTGALRRGVKDVKAVAALGRSVSVMYRKGRPERVEEATQRSLSLSLYIDGKFTSCQTNDLRGSAVEAFLDRAVAMCEAMNPDPCRFITDSNLYEGRKNLELDLWDSTVQETSPADRHAFAAAVEEAAVRAAGARLISAQATYQDDDGESIQLHSNGFEGERRSTQAWAFAEVSLTDDNDRRPEGSDVAGARYRSDLALPKAVGEGAAQSALEKVGARRMETGKRALIVEARTVGRLLGQLLGATSGRALQQRQSILEGKLGLSVGSELLDIVDDPFLVRGFGSRLSDAEGISAKVLPVFNKGVLASYFIDTYYGRKMGMAPTTGSRSNLIVTPGTASLDELISHVADGLLVRGFIGGSSNAVTGDFSLGVYGTRIESGVATYPVVEANISGCHLDLWQRLVAVGSDVYPYSSLLSPSLVFEDVQIAGT
ncbi:MAG: TldD/PmbA family protein [Myxococcota bacterium]|jgi:PmbA protein|nr:TldD/PmbA family protein [Myxococcota bacterium]